MDILKLIFEHDMLLERQPDEHDPRNRNKVPSTLEDFMRPIPTYSRFYIAGTRMDDKGSIFGLNQLIHFKRVEQKLDIAFQDFRFTSSKGQEMPFFSDALAGVNVGDAVVIHRDDLTLNPEELSIGESSGVYEHLPQLIAFLDASCHVVFKEPAQNGYDFHIFSAQNLYENLFISLKELISDNLRLFSINGKRLNSERLFYFETYRLDRLPHGFKEVYPETIP